eukprot:9502796-Pyramimonas_sp.AAC.1
MQAVAGVPRMQGVLVRLPGACTFLGHVRLRAYFSLGEQHQGASSVPLRVASRSIEKHRGENS